ncbi:F-actin-monooxygenase Mical isoform X11 [Episyrphus balteatus]|uniref:F-actin-monooxygenase Mical isoform X11 n=1 Tax=Episyrphus balteatus TaxID=286459 RepID=UPI0024862F43|nr:F-actin-monooxygenase Mical isoform X11 [Episyrphus balteatus]
MSRSSNQRQQQQLLAQQQQQMADNDAAAAAAEMFDMFCLATTMRQVLGLHRNICDAIGLRPAPLNEFYPKLKAKIRSWKAQALWKKFDARASHRAYSKGNACTGTRVLVIGAGPCGLRTAIEAQLLGAKVVVVEKRDRISRNNVLHLWPFVITDLRNLGAKKFYGKFCAGSIDHISIRQIQCILLKVALLLGVEVHEGVSFEGTIEPSEGCGWRAAISPEDHAVSHYEFDVLIGADGKRNTLEAFKRKEFRGKLAIAITANFINKKTEAEAKAEEISGVAFIFNQAFFKELYHTTGIDLENIVYYKDETHYFVMTAKKHSLIDKGVIMQDFADPAELLAPQNVNTDKLLDYAREAAEFSTKYQMPNLEFAVNHYGKPDVAMFDFTSMFAAESSSRVIVRKNYRLLQCLVGDSLLEPFWPTGSGCARGFLSSMDAAYAIKLWNNPRNSILGVLAQRESIYRLLAQTTPENLQRDIGSYTVDPATRYPNLNRTSVNMYQVKHLIDTDDKAILEQTYMDTNALQASQADTPVRRKRRTGDTLPLSAVLLRWIKAQLHSYEFVQNLNEVSDCFTNGKVLCALINRYRPDLVDFNSIKELPAADCNDLAFKILDKELKISKVMSGKDSIDLDKIDSKIWLNYLEQVCEVFRGEIPHVKHPKLDVSELREKNRNNVPDFSRLLQMTSSRKAKSPMQDVADLPHATQRRSVLDEEKVKRQRKHEPGQGQLDTPRRAKKRRSAEKTTNINSKVALAFKKQAASEKCHFCKQTVYLMEKISTEGLILHRSCLKCHHCHTNLRPGGYAFDRDDPEGRFYCTQHFRLPAKAIRPMVRKPGQRKSTAHGSHAPSHLDPKTPEKPRGITESVVQLDLLDRGQTPERIEFENTDAMSDGEPSEEHIIDENEWSGRNFLQPSADSESDLSSSSDESDDDSESDIFEEANGSPIAQQTLQLATDWIGKQHYSNVNSDDSDDDFYDSSEGLADDGKDDTEGEEIKKAREMRREEVRLLPLPTNLPTDTETEVQSDSESSSADDVELNSATEISTDSEFDHDEIIREAPKIFIDDTHLRKPTKVQIKQTVIAPTTGQPKYHINNRMTHQQLTQQQLKREPQFKPLVQVDPSLLSSNRMPLQNPRPGDYLLNKTASTEGIASKKSLELKKRYLLGEQGNGNKIQKSGSTSILDSKIRSFHSNISECQKLLNAGSMKPFLDRTKVTENQTAVDKKIEITIKKTAAIDEKENVFVNSKNELNKGMEYSETVNTTLVESLNKNKPSPIIETIDLISPEKSVPIIDLTEVEIPSKMLESNLEFIKNLQFNGEDGSSKENSLVPDNKIIDLTLDSPVKSDKTVIEEVIEKPDVSKDVKEAIPDIITHIEEVNLEMITLLDHEAEKKDSPEKSEYDIQETSIQVPNIPWTIKKCIEESDSLSSSSSSSSVEDIQHFILDSTTSPDTQTGQIVPRLEVHDSSGTLMQIDSLMIIDGKYIGDPEDLKNMEIPPGMIIPEIPTQSPSPEEPITEKRKDDSPPPSSSPPQKPELKFDTKNENKIDTLKNIPLILEKSEDHTRGGVVKPDSLNIQVDDKRADSDNDKTPTAEGITRGSDSDAEITNQGGLTETELSDWTADDAISENFIDLEFVLNSNKGTIKRNKKSKKKAPLQSSLSITQEPDPEPEPEPEPCGILKNLDIEEIEFMDTGSEGSCAEAYSATNTALLRNRGYAEYTGSPRNYRHNRAPPPTEHELKTPVNECPTLPSTVSLLSQKSQSPSITTTTTTPPKPQNSPPSQTQHTNNTQSLSQSLTDSTNDIDEDSLCMLTNSNGATANNTATITTTTEESEALTVVTSPMDSSSPKTQENFQLTPSSSDPNGKTTSPSSHTTATPVTSSSSKGPTRKSSHEDLLTHSNSKRKESEEMSYEEYVRKLQQKITQISNARDSIDVRKQNRRKSSKGEGSEANSVIEGGSAKGLSVFEGGFSASVQQQPKVVLSTINVTANPAQDVHKVPVIPTLSSKLEELTKERTKQKDLIHDLVMDKLQCKKQLNAEKRLNRSRNRSIFGNNLACSSLSPTPKMTSTNTSPYHVTSSSGGDHSGSSCKENHPLSAQKINKSSPKDTKDVVQMFSEAPPRSAKQRPFSENFDPDSIDDQMCKLSKTQSFTYSSRGGNFPFKTESNGSRLNTVYASPLTVTRPSRKDEPIGTASNADKLRTEARARARLKSNQDLGLSPEEKLQLLRKRYHLDLQEASAEAAQMKSEELRARDRKMISSKSVNDIATAQLLTLQPDENSNTTTVRSDLVADFTSDPNLSQMNPMSMTNKVNRRQKDPERRKSIIQTFSSFFQKGNKKDKDIVGPISGTEKSGTSQSSAATVNSNNNGGGGDGMFSRFRISPKSKEKSKSCFDVRNIGFGDNGSSPTTPVATTPQHQYRHHHDQRSNSQDCIAKQKYQKISSYASSPQLFKNTDEQIPPPIPPLPLNYQRSDDESYATESREQKKQRAITKATRQAELKRLRIAQEIQREQEEIEVQLKELEARGVLIEKALRGEGQTIDNLEASNMGANDEKLLKELLEIWRNITQLKKRDEELGIRQQELQLEHRHAQLKEELNIRLSGSKLEKSSADVAAEGAILNEMLEIVAKRAALRPTSSGSSPVATTGTGAIGGDDVVNDGITFSGRRSSQIDESDVSQEKKQKSMLLFSSSHNHIMTWAMLFIIYILIVYKACNYLYY